MVAFVGTSTQEMPPIRLVFILLLAQMSPFERDVKRCTVRQNQSGDVESTGFD